MLASGKGKGEDIPLDFKADGPDIPTNPISRLYQGYTNAMLEILKDSLDIALG